MSARPPEPQSHGEDAEPEFTVPDDIGGLWGPDADAIELAALLTPIAGSTPLAAACVLAGLNVQVGASVAGAVAVLGDLPTGGPDQAAEALSTVLKGVPVIVAVRRHEQLTMTRWTDGVRGADLAPGLVLSGAPGALESLLLGVGGIDGLDDVVASSSISRWKAIRLLAAAARKARRT